MKMGESRENERLGVLCVLTGRSIIGIDLDKLRQLQPEALTQEDKVFLGSLSSSAFMFDLRDNDFPLGMCHFVLDSDIYLAGGVRNTLLDYYLLYPYLEYNDRLEISKDIYRFEVSLDGENMKPSISETKPIPFLPPPKPLITTAVVNISDDIYFAQDPNLEDSDREGILVFDTKRKLWNVIPFPSDYHPRDLDHCFVLQNKLFFHGDWTYAGKGCRPRPIYSFDPKTQCWSQEYYDQNHDHILNSFIIEINNNLEFCFPGITLTALPDFGKDDDIVLGWQYVEIPNSNWWFSKYQVVLYAFQFNNQRGRVLRFQLLGDPFDGIQPLFLEPPSVLLVHIGNDTVCALISGNKDSSPHPVFCMSVFTLAKAKDRDLDPDVTTSATAKTQNFLSLSVLCKHVFAVPNRAFPLLHAFIWRVQSKKRKELAP